MKQTDQPISDQIDRHSELKGLLNEIDGPLNRMNNHLKHIQDNLDGKFQFSPSLLQLIPKASKRTKIMCWISPEPYLQYHEQTKKDVLLDSGKWLLSDPIFVEWKKESVSSILWLHGIPGSGKSKLV